ncbi:hypothetical protein GCM10023188_26140 [Pontibacter saemangeumensis]|uniref:Uncharacterized protein n=1 Tax=Pontibacter saemangeumensis TaxID=1084525 RepID=A0ABP8LS22_9BACT
MTRKENKQLYMELLTKVTSKFTTEYADKVKVANPELKFSTITNVRYGRSPKLDVLIFMIRVDLPHFNIPEKFLKAEELKSVA